MSLALTFDNQSGLSDDDVYITFQVPDPSAFDVTYGGTAVKLTSGNIMSECLSLKTIGSAGLVITSFISVVVYVSYGAPITATTAAPSPSYDKDTDYLTPYQVFELTMNDGNGDQGNMTAINYFTAVMSITSKDASGNTLQSTSYNKTSAQVGADLSAIASADAVVKNKSDVVRYLGPSTFGVNQTIPYPSFLDYLKAIGTAGQTTSLQNNNAFALANQDNYNFIFDLTATYDTDGNCSITGTVNTEVTINGTTSNGPSYTVGVAISASNEATLNNQTYGQVIESNVSFTGFDPIEKYMVSVGLDAGDIDTYKRTIIGEITTGILMGYLNSDYKPNGGAVALKDMSSKEWWGLNPVVAFGQVQSNADYYNQYAGVLFNDSDNAVYSIPYSDRLGDGPLVNSVQWNGTPVASWEIGLQPALSNASTATTNTGSASDADDLTLDKAT